MQEARQLIEDLVAEGAVVYGVTTGFGDLASVSIAPTDTARLQENLLMSHAAGVGPAFPREIVRAMLLLRANTLALGHSGCRPVLVDRLLDFLRLGVHPVVPEQGSLGASGDLAPLAHLALPLIGRGQAELNGLGRAGLIALREVGLDPLELGPKEGLALLNGTQMMSSIGALLLADADRLVRTASVAAAMSVEALLGTDVAFAAAYQLARPHPGQVAVAAELRHLLRDSGCSKVSRVAHKVRIPTRCGASHRSTALSGTRSSTSARPRHRAQFATTTRSSSSVAAWLIPTRSRRVAAGSSVAATSTGTGGASARLREARQWPSSARSASDARPSSSTRGSTAGCRRFSPRRPASTLG